MIAVIADDLTGAAEIAGIGWRHGLRTEILRRNQDPGDADLVVYDTDSRHASRAEASRRVVRVLRRLKPGGPLWIYKKVDSVLRGNVVAEINALREGLGVKRCLLVPANPSAGRTIQAGRYFIHAVPIDQTDFRNDPTHPRRSADVLELLGRAGATKIAVRNHKARLPGSGIVVGEAITVADLRSWSRRVGDDSLIAGGGEFFSALLAQRGLLAKRIRQLVGNPPKARTLFICGSLSASCQGFIERSRQSRWPVLAMPLGLTRGKASEVQRSEWARKAGRALARHSRVILTVGRGVVSGARDGVHVEQLLAMTGHDVLSVAQPDRICVEGGSTAAALLGALEWKRLTVVGEYARGVVAVQIAGVKSVLILKPGSYAWPELLTA